MVSSQGHGSNLSITHSCTPYLHLSQTTFNIGGYQINDLTIFQLVEQPSQLGYASPSTCIENEVPTHARHQHRDWLGSRICSMITRAQERKL